MLNGAVSVGIADTIALALTSVDGPSKVILTNDSTNIIYIAVNGPAVLNSGARLNASGGSMVLDIDKSTHDIPNRINAIATGAASNLCFIVLN